MTSLKVDILAMPVLTVITLSGCSLMSLYATKCQLFESVSHDNLCVGCVSPSPVVVATHHVMSRKQKVGECQTYSISEYEYR